MGEWWENRWFRRHAMFVPFGIFVASELLSYLTEPSSWNIRNGLKSAGELVDLGTVVYAMAAVLTERGIRMWFWALDQREQWREKWRSEARAEGLFEGQAQGEVQGRAQGQADLLNQMWASARADNNQELVAQLERIAQEKGIALGDPLPR